VTLYELLLFLHITAAIIWLGAGFVLGMLVFGAGRSGDHAKETGYHSDVAWLAPRLFIPASMSTFLLGILLVLEGSWSFDQLWIVIALAGWASSFLLGILYFKPESERIEALVGQQGSTHGEVSQRVHRLNVVDRLQLTILFLVVADMVVKPTGDDVGLLVGAGVILGAAAALAASSIRRGPPQPSTARAPAA
jgi:uncharacterized membrane protein